MERKWLAGFWLNEKPRLWSGGIWGGNITGSSGLYKLSGRLTRWTARQTAVSQTFHRRVHSCIFALLFVPDFHWTCAHNIVCAQYKIKERFGKCWENMRHNFLSLSWFWCSLCRKHLACDARFIVGTIIKCITDDPISAARYEKQEKQNQQITAEIALGDKTASRIRETKRIKINYSVIEE